MAIKIKKKKKKAEEVEQIDSILEQDQFLQTSDKSIGWLAQNRSKAVIGVVVLAVAVIAVIFLAKYSEKTEMERTAALADAVTSLETPIASPVPADPAAPPVGRRFPNAESKYQEVLDKADTVLTAYPKSDVAQPARLIKARAELGLGKYDEAVTLYQEWLTANPKADERPMVLQAVASAQSAAGKSDDAVKSLSTLSDVDKKLYGELASYQIARIYDTAGNKAKAKESYDAFIKEYPESGKIELAKLRRQAL